MNELKQQAIDLRNRIKREQKEIDNPAMVASILNELDFFIENVESTPYDND